MTVEPNISFNEATPISIDNVMHEAFMEYSMSVIVSRALPDCRDGMKPVHRRIIFAMHEGSYYKNKPYNKSAKIVGDVMGNYHPHGDNSIYEAMVRMTQDFSLRLPLIDGQGNFGSLDGDSAAAMRYTEARMSKAAHSMTEDMHLDTVKWIPNYDGKRLQPTVLPTMIPNLIINGGTGIAVGMATNMPAHNPSEALKSCLLILDNPNASLQEVMEIMPGPDFPTGGIIKGVTGIKQAYETGRGTITISGKFEIEEKKNGRSQIVITEFPYSVNKAKFQTRVAELVNNKTIEGVSSISDESDRDENVRVVIETKKDGDPNVILNKLQKHTDLLTTFSVNSVCLDPQGRPKLMGIMEQVRSFVNFRLEVVRRRTIHKLDSARDAIHKQIGLFAATSEIDRVVKTIRSSMDTDEARSKLMSMEFKVTEEFRKLLEDADPDQDEGEINDVFFLSEIQVNSILEMNLRRLTGMERDKIAQTARNISIEISGYTEILNHENILTGVVRKELMEMIETYPSKRLTSIEHSEIDLLSDEDLIEERDIVLTFTSGGYVKRTNLEEFREQKRGGKGKSGINTKDGDFVSKIITCSTHSPLIFFTSKGTAHSKKAFQLPEGAPNSRGRSLVNDLPQLDVSNGEKISSVLALPTGEDVSEYSMVFVTDFGSIRRSAATDFLKIRKTGKIAMSLEDDNGKSIGNVTNVLLCKEDDTILIATAKGLSIRIRVGDLRVINSRKSTGVLGIKISNGDTVISATHLLSSPFNDHQRIAYLNGGEATVGVAEDQQVIKLTNDIMEEMKSSEQFVLTTSEKGYGKRSSAYSFRVSNRNGKGVTCMKITKDTGKLISCFPIDHDDGIMLVTQDGQTIRTSASEVNVQGRSTRGVKLFNVNDDSTITTVARVIG